MGSITGETRGVPAEVVVEVTRRIAAAAGTGGMVVGQVVDMISEGQAADAKIMEFMHAHKTGALIDIAVISGGLLGGGSDAQIDALSTYGKKIGLAFQIADDILDIEGDVDKLGKPIGSDVGKGKSTYPSLYGLAKSKELARRAVDDAVNALDMFDERADPLRAIAQFIVDRES